MGVYKMNGNSRKAELIMALVEKGITYEMIAEHLGVSYPTVSRWMRNPDEKHYGIVMRAIGEM